MFVVAIRQDSNNCLLLKPEQTNIPPELEQKIKPDDRYLIEAQQRVEGATIVTTDAPLREALNEVGRRFSSREEFLNLIRIF